MSSFPPGGRVRPRIVPRARGGKVLAKVLVAAAVVLVVSLVGAIVFIDSIARAGIAAAGSRALGARTTVESASVGLVSGHTSVDGISVDNPTGFSDRRFVALGSIEVDAGLRELLGERVEIARVALEDLRVVIEKRPDGEMNVQAFADHLAASKGAPAAEDGPSREILVREFSLRRVRVELVGFLGGSERVVEVALPDIVLRDLSSRGSVDLLASEVSGVVVGSIVSAVVAARIEGLGADVLGGLESAANGIGSAIGGPLREAVGKGIEDVGGALRDLGSGLVGAVGDAGKKVGETIEKGVGEALDGIFGGGKK